MRLNVLFWGLVLGALLSTSANAEIYKWVDSSGKVIYSETPPPAGVKTLDSPSILPPPVNPVPPPQAAAVPVAPAEPSSQQDTPELDAVNAQLEEQVEKLCEALRNNLKVLNLSVRAYRINKNGARVYIDDKDREKEKAEIQKKIDENCK